MHLDFSFKRLIYLLCVCLFSTIASANSSSSNSLSMLCKEIGSKLGSVSISDCERQHLINSQQYTTKGRPFAYKIYPPLPSRQPLGRVLLMCGIHGDEYSAVSYMFKWLE